MPTQWVEVESSNVARLAYEAPNLFVEFKSGAQCRYENVPPTVFVELLAAESVGKALDKTVKGVYEYAKVQ